MTESRREERGRQAERPTDIPWDGWRDVIWRVARELETDQTTVLASSVAFYGLLALFPALLATASVYGLLADPVDVVKQVSQFSVGMPWTARSLITQQLTDLVQNSSTGLTLGLITSLSVSLFSASSGVLALIRGVNIAYDEQETRGWLRLRALAVLFTMGLSLFFVVAVATITILPPLLESIDLHVTARLVISILRWPLLAMAVMLGLSILYRHGPDRAAPTWRWVMPGALAATLLWTGVSFLFSLYAENFGRFNKTYGALGAVVVLSLWMYLSSWAILLGAELNAELEHQTASDSTVGPMRPMGQRNAVMADTLGELRPMPESKKSWKDLIRETLADWTRAGRRKSKQS